MNFPPPFDQVRRLLARSPVGGRSCLVCGAVIRDGDRSVYVRGETYAHYRCATYRLRQARVGDDRLGHPPRTARRR